MSLAHKNMLKKIAEIQEDNNFEICLFNEGFELIEFIFSFQQFRKNILADNLLKVAVFENSGTFPTSNKMKLEHLTDLLECYTARIKGNSTIWLSK